MAQALRIEATAARCAFCMACNQTIPWPTDAAPLWLSCPVCGGIGLSQYERIIDSNTALYVNVMTFQKGRLCVGGVRALYYADGWCYDSVISAVIAAEAWDLAREAEPSGWFRHPSTGRRRPDGDPSREYVSR